eukprot:CAMPEP_0168753588 /NCGR_PEP_ID=MMETSP0724-20121128/19022_1 /TAXON_ID=265536 /ORGANISM="Amphiprora sp., Strain CCMP467" /LENGTH=44 /DNA_ID= /DNA_START= /DNA_END= /DNA_ORIENTATION=
MKAVWDNLLAMFSSPLKESDGNKPSTEEGVLQKRETQRKGEGRK